MRFRDYFEGSQVVERGADAEAIKSVRFAKLARQFHYRMW